jgi:tol-pal system protein YbgF
MTVFLNKPDTRKAWKNLGLFAIGAGVLSIGVLSAFPAVAQSSRDIINRLNRMENEIQTLSRSVYKGEAPPPGTFSGDANTQANTEIRLQQMESEISALRGMIEEQAFGVRNLQNQLERMSADYDLRMQDLERAGQKTGQAEPRPNVYRGNAAEVTPDETATASTDERPPQPVQPTQIEGGSGQLGQLTDSGSGNTTGVMDDAATAYENAFALLKNEQYDQSAAAFKAFISSNPDHPLTGNAQYWLGESYYARGNFEQAARTFAESYQKYPKGSKSPDNLLKLGMSLASLGNNSDACIALGQIEAEFSTGAGPVLRRAEQEMTRLGC